MYNIFLADMKHKVRLVPFILLFLLCITGCDEDSFVKVIDVEHGDFPPKLAVTATLDTDSGRFTLIMREAHSLGYYKTFKSEMQEIIRNGTVRLFENGEEIFSKSGVFDLSIAGYGRNGYHLSVTDISAVAGRTYRLEIDIDGYDKATATAVMPEAPIISDILVDVEHPVKKENIMEISSLSYSSSFSYSDYYYTPFSLNIEDNTPYPDFYSFQLAIYINSKYTGDEYEYEYEYTERKNVATSNLAMIQDNPDVESMDLMLDGENYDLYSFDLMMLTDATFANTNIRLDLYSPFNDFYTPENYDKPSTSYMTVKYFLIVKHHTQEAFKQYRSMAFQLAGLGFFSEPVFITSNMENAYGGFSLHNTKRFTLHEYRIEM